MSVALNLNLSEYGNHRHLFLDTLLAGSLAGFVTESLLFPIESFKFARQMGLKTSFRGLWRGYMPAVLGAGPTAAAFLYTYNTIKYYFQPLVDESHHYRVHVLAACAGEAASLAVKVPSDNVKHRHQVLTNPVSSVNFMRRMLHRAGLGSFFRGYRPQLLSKVHSSVILYPMWELLMNQEKLRTNKELEPYEMAACGALAASCVGMVTNPLDVARGRLIFAELKQLEIARLGRLTALKLKEEKAKRLETERNILQLETERLQAEEYKVGASTARTKQPEALYKLIGELLRAKARRFKEEENRMRAEAVRLRAAMRRLKAGTELATPDRMKLVGEYLKVDRMPELYASLRNVYNKEGFKGLYAGVLARTARITLGGAVFFYAYASAMDYLARQDPIEALEVKAIVILESSDEKVEELIDQLTTWHPLEETKTTTDETSGKTTDASTKTEITAATKPIAAKTVVNKVRDKD